MLESTWPFKLEIPSLSKLEKQTFHVETLSRSLPHGHYRYLHGFICRPEKAPDLLRRLPDSVEVQSGFFERRVKRVGERERFRKKSPKRSSDEGSLCKESYFYDIFVYARVMFVRVCQIHHVSRFLRLAPGCRVFSEALRQGVGRERFLFAVCMWHASKSKHGGTTTACYNATTCKVTLWI